MDETRAFDIELLIQEFKTFNCKNKKEVQAHGFLWETEILLNVYGATVDELKQLKYTSKNDLPSCHNRLDNCDISVKTTHSSNLVCMADCLRLYDSVYSGNPIHLVVIHYNQNDVNNTKTIKSIIEVDLTSSNAILFGSITRSQIEELVKHIKNIPQKRKPSLEEKKIIYDLRDNLQKISGAIHLDIKCNSTQSRLQCSFNKFQEFIEKHPSRIISKSFTNYFRGGKITESISSARRQFKKLPIP